MNVGDLVLAGPGMFRVTGVYLGGVNSQNLIGLEVINKNAGSANGKLHSEMLTPEELVLNSHVYRKVNF